MPHESTVDPNANLGETHSSMVRIVRVPSYNRLEPSENTAVFDSPRTPLALSNSALASRPQTPSHSNHDLDDDSDSNAEELL
jgi:hypothetical protein